MATKLTFHAVMNWSNEECRDFLARMRWPNGPLCPKCGASDPWSITRKTRTKNAVQALYKCSSCRRQFSATVGTIFEDSKIPLQKWLAALYLMVSSKKGISAHQLYRMLGLGSYRSAWFMAHRIREAMRDKGFLPPLTGTIEADETYVGGRQRGHWTQRERVEDEIKMGIRTKRKSPLQDKAIVFGMLERDGTVRTMKVSSATQRTLEPILRAYIDTLSSRLITDGHPAYRLIKKYIQHDVINHETEYVRGSVHTQGIEGYWSLLKRGIVGVFHHVGENHLPSYLDEFNSGSTGGRFPTWRGSPP